MPVKPAARFPLLAHRPRAVFRGLLKALQRAGPGLRPASRHERNELSQRLRTERGERGEKLEAMAAQRSADLEEPELPRHREQATRSPWSWPESSAAAIQSLLWAKPTPGESGEAAVRVSGSAEREKDAPSPPDPREAIALVETIQAFVRSNRPGLELTLRGAWRGRLAIERSGPSSVSLRLESGRPIASAESMEAIKEAMKESGLVLTSIDCCAVPTAARY